MTRMAPQKVRSRSVAALAFAAVWAALAVLVGGCRQPADWFPEYRGENLISGRALSADWRLDDVLRALPSEVAGLYVGFEPVSDVDPPAPGAEVYRLEVRNLVPDGSFALSDVAAVTPGEEYQGWRFYRPSPVQAATHEIVDSSSQYAIHGNTLHYLTGSSTARLDFTIRDPTWGVADGFLETASYFVRFWYRAGTLPVVFEFRDSESPIWKAPTIWGSVTGGLDATPLWDNVVAYPPQAIVTEAGSIRPSTGATEYYFSFGSLNVGESSPQNAYIDDFRVVRTDLPPRIVLDLPSSGATTYPLLSGSYRFTIWVRDDPTAGASEPNRYHAATLCVTLAAGALGLPAGSTEGSTTFVFPVARGDSDWSAWTLLAFETTESVQITPPHDRDQPVMSVSIAPTDWYSDGGRLFDAGSILISSPGLEFISP